MRTFEKQMRAGYAETKDVLEQSVTVFSRWLKPLYRNNGITSKNNPDPGLPDRLQQGPLKAHQERAIEAYRTEAMGRDTAEERVLKGR